MKPVPSASASHPARRARAAIARAHGMAHAHRRGRRNSQRNHVGDAGVVQHNLVRGQRDRRQIPRRKRGQIPRAHFQQYLPAAGAPSRTSVLQPRDLRPSPMLKERMPARALIAPGKAHQRHRHHNRAKHSRNGRAVHSHRREPQLAVDQNPVAKPVDQVRQQRKSP